MATVAAIQAVLGLNPGDPQIVAGPLSTDATKDEYSVSGGIGTRTPANATRWVQTLRADTAAVQAAAMRTALNAA